jgi:glyoxylase-like metal-dependent hydrolase (beta-lactamase superfamily II)
LVNEGEAVEQQLPLEESGIAHNDRADDVRDDGTHEVAPDLVWKRLAIANVMFYGVPGAGSGQWVLIDAGVMGTTGMITGAAEERFGSGVRPAAIVMTHGHFDHVGALENLAQQWDVPIYAHELELPYLNGTSSYPPPDPTVGGGMMALLSPMYPRGPVNVSRWLQALPSDGSVPSCQAGAGFTRRATRSATLRCGAKATAPSSRVMLLSQLRRNRLTPWRRRTRKCTARRSISRPDWESARTSVQQLAALEPELVVTGHGPAMRGADMRAALHVLANDFTRVAVPEHGRYVNDAVRNNA